jgi:hypothetical protein
MEIGKPSFIEGFLILLIAVLLHSFLIKVPVDLII